MAIIPDWIQSLELIQSILTVLGGGATLKLLFNWLQRRRIGKATNSFELGFSVSVILDHLRAKLVGCRACILAAHNGGSDITVSRPLFTSVRFQHAAPGFSLIDWQSVPVVDGYWRILQAIEENDGVPIRVIPSELAPQSPLRNLYENEGIGYSWVFKLFAEPDCYWYVSVNVSDEPDGDPAPYQLEAIRVARAQLIRRLRDKRLIT